MFFEVLDVIRDDGETADLKVTWCKKVTRGWKQLVTENVKITRRDYGAWVSYTPPGEMIHEDRQK